MLRVRAALLALALSAGACESPPAPDSGEAAAVPPAAAAPHPAAPAAVAAEPDPAAGDPLGTTEAPTADCGTADACHEAAVQQEREQHATRAIALHATACDLGSARSCYRAGELVRDGRGVEPDDHRARQFFERGCARGSPAACDALGH